MFSFVKKPMPSSILEQPFHRMSSESSVLDRFVGQSMRGILIVVSDEQCSGGIDEGRPKGRVLGIENLPTHRNMLEDCISNAKSNYGILWNFLVCSLQYITPVCT